MQQPEIAARQFGTVAAEYLHSAVHAQGADLAGLAEAIRATATSRVLDLGCGAGHASYAVARHVGEVHAYDVSAEMLTVVAAAAQERGLENIRVHRGAAESLPFENGTFDAIVSRLSAHHWRDVHVAIREMRRVLKPQGVVVIIDSAGASDPLCDSHLQTIELLRDRSHVRNYTVSEWQSFFADAGFRITTPKTWRISIDYASWIARMRTPEARSTAIRHVWQDAPEEVRAYYRVQSDGSFELEVMQICASG